MKPLILAEKPSAARAIAAALGGFQRREGYLESTSYRLTWAVGHLVELCDAQEYDARYRRWALTDLPIVPHPFRLRPVARTAAQFRLVSKLMQDAPRLINACDSGREGELIFGYVCELAGVTRPVERLWVQSLTPQAIRKAFADLRPGENYRRLYDSAQCRSRGDWLVGINATRAFTVQAGELLSVGRVQTPTLALLVRREQEIEAFKPEPFWQVDATFATAAGEPYVGHWFGADGDRLKAGDVAAAIVQRCQGQPGRVATVDSQEKESPPPQLFDLTSLQRLANQRYRLSAAQTLAAAQSLYEAGLITYPRTDSRYLSRDLIATLPGVLKALGPSYPEIAAQADLGRLLALGGRVVNDKKVTDHHAIIPTGHAPKALSGANARVYDLIARRLLAQCLPLHRYREVEVWTHVAHAAGEDRFRTRARQVLIAGWKAAEPDWGGAAAKAATRGAQAAQGEAPELDEASDWVEGLPALSQGERVRTVDVTSHAGQTQPPKRYTEARLLAAMETAGRELDDEGLREAMKERGLGTPATRAAIIERLKDVGYIELKGKDLVPTVKGRELVAWVERSGAQVLLAPDLTGEWEHLIGQVQAGTYAPEQLLAAMERLTREIVTGVARLPADPKAVAKRSRGRKGAGLAELEASRGQPGDAQAEASELPPVGGPCALCGRPVIRGSRDWLCANHECSLRIPRFLCGHVLTEAEVAALLTKQRTPLITGFTSRQGKPFSAYLVLEQGSVGFEFNNRPQKGKTTGRRRSAAAAEGASPTRRTKATASKTKAPASKPSAAAGKASAAAGRPSGAASKSSSPTSRAPKVQATLESMLPGGEFAGFGITTTAETGPRTPGTRTGRRKPTGA